MALAIRGILFDLGDTLLNFGKVDIQGMFEQGAAKAYQFLTAIGQPLMPFPRFFRRQLRAIRWNVFKSRLTRREFNSMDILGRLSLAMGHNLTPEQMNELAWQFYVPLRGQAVMESGTVELLTEFRQRGLILGLVSNTFLPCGVLDRHLKEEGLLDLLPVRVYSCEVTYRKPHPGIFDVALKRSGLQAADTLFVGDSLEADIAGANRSGLISVLKDPTQRHRNSRIKPIHRITNLQQLRQVVEQYSRV